jgi:hypothetical protein
LKSVLNIYFTTIEECNEWRTLINNQIEQTKNNHKIKEYTNNKDYYTLCYNRKNNNDKFKDNIEEIEVLNNSIKNENKNKEKLLNNITKNSKKLEELQKQIEDLKCTIENENNLIINSEKEINKLINNKNENRTFMLGFFNIFKNLL